MSKPQYMVTIASANQIESDWDSEGFEDAEIEKITMCTRVLNAGTENFSTRMTHFFS